jgi:BMFP domain-containing protein YqiC
MGRERTVLIWEVHYQMVLGELGQVEQRLAALEARLAAGTAPPEDARQFTALQARARELRARLQALGPSPKARMG